MLEKRREQGRLGTLLKSAMSLLPERAPHCPCLWLEHALSHFSHWLLMSRCYFRHAKMDDEGYSRIPSTYLPPSPETLPMDPGEASLSLSAIDRILGPLHTFPALVIPGALLPPLRLHPIGLHRCPDSLLIPPFSLARVRYWFRLSSLACGGDRCQRIHLASPTTIASHPTDQ